MRAAICRTAIGAVSRSQQQHQPGCSNVALFKNMMLVILASLVVFSCSSCGRGLVQALPFPAPNFNNCNNYQGCCPPPYNGTIIENYVFDTKLPMRIRRGAHLVDDAYIAKYQKAYELQRSLPDSDGRSYKNQANLHCAYCNAAFYYPEAGFKPLEIHFGWLFLAWHRLYIYFQERIFAKLLCDDEFALPFWNWDNQSPVPPLGNVLPPPYASPIYKNKPSLLYDPNRNPCTPPPNVIDFLLRLECANQTEELKASLRATNSRVMYTQMVTGAPISSLFFGRTYSLDGYPGKGAGTLENNPHGPVHAWTGNPNASIPFRDMGIFEFSAFDPVFFAHHSNIDRMWEIWKSLPGGRRKDIRHPDYLNSEFLFYDENGALVKVKVSQASDLNTLRYKYEDIPISWLQEGSDAASARCYPASPSAIKKLIYSTPRLDSKSFTNFSGPSITFRVRRPVRKERDGEEVLLIPTLKFQNITTALLNVNAFLYFPTANLGTPITCPEFTGILSNTFVEFSVSLPDSQKEWRLAIGSKLRSLGMNEFSHVVVTLVQEGLPQIIQLKHPQIIYLKE